MFSTMNLFWLKDYQRKLKLEKDPFKKHRQMEELFVPINSYVYKIQLAKKIDVGIFAEIFHSNIFTHLDCILPSSCSNCCYSCEAYLSLQST